MPIVSEPRKIAMVYGTLPVIQEIQHFRSLKQEQDSLTIVTTIELAAYIKDLLPDQEGIDFIELPDHPEDLTFIPGLEKALQAFDIVIVKERLGFYAYQAVKAKWSARFKLVYLIDNLTPFPAQDIERLTTIREAVENSAEVFLVQSAAAYTMLKDIEGISEDRIHKLPPYCGSIQTDSAEQKAQARKELGIPRAKHVISHIAQLEWEEGVLDLVHGCKIALLRHPELNDKLEIIICGIGSFSHEVRRRIIKLKMEHLVKIVPPTSQAVRNVWLATDCVFHSSIQSRDRLEGDPYRFMMPMVNKKPIIAGRSVLVEEFIGKHRIDFCIGSSQSLSKAIVKSYKAKGLCKDVVQKNFDKVESKFTAEIANKNMCRFLDWVAGEEKELFSSKFSSAIDDVEKLVKNKKYLDAVGQIEQLFANPDLPLHQLATALRLVGDCFTKLNDLVSAKESYEKALEIDPYCPKVFIGLGTVELVAEKYDAAMLSFQKAVAFSPDDSMALLGLGLAFQGLEEFEESNKWVCSSLDTEPDNSAAIFTLVRNSNALEVYDSAIKYINSYLKFHPLDIEMMFTLSALYFRTGDLHPANKWVLKILEIDKNNKRAIQLRSSIEKSHAALGTLS